MTEKQRFLVYIHLAGLLASIRKSNNVGISEAVKIMLENGIIQKLEDLETGYYLESDAYLEEELLIFSTFPLCSQPNSKPSLRNLETI